MGSLHGYSFHSFEVIEDSQSQNPLLKAATEGVPIILDDDAESCSDDHEHRCSWPEDDKKQDDKADEHIRTLRSGSRKQKTAIQPKVEVTGDHHGALRRDPYTDAEEVMITDDDDDGASRRNHYTADDLIKREMERNRLFWEACLAKWQ